MKRTKPSILITFTTCAALLLSVCASGLITNRASAAQNDNDRRADKVSKHLRLRQNNGNDENVKVVVQLNGPMSTRLTTLLNRNGIHHKRHFNTFNSSAVEL